MKASSQHHAAEALFRRQYPFTHEIENYVGPRGCLGHFKEERLTIPGFKPCSTQSVANRYIDYTIMPHAYLERDSIDIIGDIKLMELNTSSWPQTDIKMIVHFNPLNPELNPICYLLALLGAHYFPYVSRIRVKLLTFRLLKSYIYGAPILGVSRSHTTTQHSR